MRALNIRYATFYFTDVVIMMDLLPYDVEQIHSYMLPRSMGKKPVEDFCALSNILGQTWWRERNRTKKRYMASRLVLENAQKPAFSKATIIPASLIVPAVRASSLITLDLRAADLNLANLHTRIKQAYRQQVKKCHPDMGGNSQAFRKVHEAYEMLLRWSKQPSFIHRSGFPDKWLYQGASNRWIQPTINPSA